MSDVERLAAILNAVEFGYTLRPHDARRIVTALEVADRDRAEQESWKREAQEAAEIQLRRGDALQARIDKARAWNRRAGSVLYLDLEAALSEPSTPSAVEPETPGLPTTEPKAKD
jgi:hypothetical protein